MNSDEADKLRSMIASLSPADAVAAAELTKKEMSPEVHENPMLQEGEIEMNMIKNATPNIDEAVNPLNVYIEPSVPTAAPPPSVYIEPNVPKEQVDVSMASTGTTSAFSLPLKTFTGDWRENRDEEGRIYYYNKKTRESSWELPTGCQEISDEKY